MSEKLRYGFTTGSCAAAAAKAAAYMLISGKLKNDIMIMTPKQVPFYAKIVEIDRAEKYVSCGVIKDGGDDPDITTGLSICATVSFSGNHVITIDGGQGVGRVTKPGLDQPVGNAAINHVPREMILKEVQEVCEVLDYRGGLSVVIFVPGGEEIAQKTFNGRLGILGGISILGTTGIVEPMSTKALLDTIFVELRQKKEMGYREIAITPGNYGLDFMKNTYDYHLDQSVKCSNFIGDAIDMAIKLGFKEILLTGHIGKMIKVTGGIYHTHSKEADCRMELLGVAALKAGCNRETVLQILDCVTTKDAIAQLKHTICFSETCRYLADRTKYYLDKKAEGQITIEFMVYENEYGLLYCSEGAEKLLKKLKAYS